MRLYELCRHGFNRACLKMSKHIYSGRHAMKKQPYAITQSTNSATLADVLERILDKGLVIAGDIKIKLVDIELLTIQIRLMIASVEKAKELGMDWWVTNKDFNSKAIPAQNTNELEELKKRIEILETKELTVKTTDAQRR